MVFDEQSCVLGIIGGSGLYDLDGLTDIGACRLCLVEVKRQFQA